MKMRAFGPIRRLLVPGPLPLVPLALRSLVPLAPRPLVLRSPVSSLLVSRLLALSGLVAVAAAGTSAAWADVASKSAKITELLQLTGARQFLHEVNGKFDQEEAARAFGRYYSDNVTERDLDAILAYYRSPAGQKDVSASRAALADVQHLMASKRPASVTAGAPAAAVTVAGASTPAAAGAAPPTVSGAAAVTAAGASTPTAASAAPPTVSGAAAVTAVDVAAHSAAVAAMPNAGTNAGTNAPASNALSTTQPWTSPPRAPDGKVVASPSSPEQCEVPTSAAPKVHAVPPSGRSVVCVCTDEKGTLTRDPIIAESSGDSRVDSGALKMARVGSGRYIPPTLAGQPQSACFRFAIDFQHQQ